MLFSTGHVYLDGTHSSNIESSAADVLGMRGVGGVCEMCLALGGVEVEGGE